MRRHEGTDFGSATLLELKARPRVNPDSSFEISQINQLNRSKNDYGAEDKRLFGFCATGVRRRFN